MSLTVPDNVVGMESWTRPEVPELPGRGRGLRPVRHGDRPDPGRRARTTEAGIYVCGITPYDATHLGHAATYLAFDLVQRVWLDAGRTVHYVQNVTDVDDPLLERAGQTGENWVELAEREIELFREDMTALRVLPPDEYVGAVESVVPITEAIETLLESGAAYRVDDDIYFDVTASKRFGYESELRPRDDARTVRPARRRSDPLPASAIRSTHCCGAGTAIGEPFWDTAVGSGRPGLAHRVLGDRAEPARHGLRRPGRRLGPDLSRITSTRPPTPRR